MEHPTALRSSGLTAASKAAFGAVAAAAAKAAFRAVAAAVVVVPTSVALAVAVTAALTAALSAPLAAQDLPTKPVLTLDAARSIAAAAEAHARQNQWNVTIVVMNDAGQLIHLVRMDGAGAPTVEIAQRKARSAALYGRPTQAFAQGAAGGSHVPLVLPDAYPLRGALPIRSGDVVVGAIGVSGVTGEQDEQIAQAGIDGLATVR